MDPQKSSEPDDSGASGPEKDNQSGDSKPDSSEWLRDQTGEDHNLSGSTTYRTLPPQPEGGDQPDLDGGDKDTKERQSNR